MTKQELVRDMKEFVKNEARIKDEERKEKRVPSSFITKAAIGRYWGRAEKKVDELVKGLEQEGSGSYPKYFIPDVAERIMDRMRPGA